MKPRHPDFKRKDGTLPLWLNSAPDWVLSELKGVVFDVQIYESKNVLDGQTQKSNYGKKSEGMKLLLFCNNVIQCIFAHIG